jgi:hypothetical protein
MAKQRNTDPYFGIWCFWVHRSSPIQQLQCLTALGGTTGFGSRSLSSFGGAQNASLLHGGMKGQDIPRSDDPMKNAHSDLRPIVMIYQVQRQYDALRRRSLADESEFETRIRPLETDATRLVEQMLVGLVSEIDSGVAWISKFREWLEREESELRTARRNFRDGGTLVHCHSRGSIATSRKASDGT